MVSQSDPLRLVTVKKTKKAVQTLHDTQKAMFRTHMHPRSLNFYLYNLQIETEAYTIFYSIIFSFNKIIAKNLSFFTYNFLLRLSKSWF